MGGDRHLLALGDCNTAGMINFEPFAYPVLLGSMLGVKTVNCGHTMSTIREGWEYALRRLNANTAYFTIQFGLVDSWVTFRGAPYVLNYPDNLLRLVARKLVKKLKKTARKLGAHQRLGEVNIVSQTEFQRRLREILHLARQRSPKVAACLIAAPPTLDAQRNSRLRDYNRIMEDLARIEQCNFVDTYSTFENHSEHYADVVHLNAAGHKIVAHLCAQAFKQNAGLHSPLMR